MIQSGIDDKQVIQNGWSLRGGGTSNLFCFLFYNPLSVRVRVRVKVRISVKVRVRVRVKVRVQVRV